MTGEVRILYLYSQPVALLLIQKEGSEWTIRGTWVMAGFRGKNIGSRLISELLEDFNRENPNGRIWVNITSGAEGFYAKYGFVIPGYRTDTPEPMSVGLYSKEQFDLDIFFSKFGRFDFEVEWFS